MTDRDLDAAMFSVWLHGDWFFLTRSMTTEEKDAAADAVRRHEATVHESGDNLIDDLCLRWWDPAYRRNVYGVDTWRVAVNAVVLVEHPDFSDPRRGQVDRRGARTVQLVHGDGSTVTYHFEQIVRVLSSPVDEALARLDGTADAEGGERP